MKKMPNKIVFLFYCLFILLFFGFSCKTDKAAVKQDMNNSEIYKKLRYEMVEKQIISRGVKDKNVLDAMLKVERHKFVPENLQKHAYEDNPLPIGKKQTISQPYIVALMTELLKPDKHNRILEIGTGSGYQAAILAEICSEVFTIEIIPELGLSAEKLLKQLGYKNIKVRIGDGYLGWEEHSPYDKIILTCAPEDIPNPLIDQLKEGGVIVAPLGDFFQELVSAKKVKGKIIRKNIIPVRFVPMIRR